MKKIIAWVNRIMENLTNNEDAEMISEYINNVMVDQIV